MGQTQCTRRINKMYNLSSSLSRSHLEFGTKGTLRKASVGNLNAPTRETPTQAAVTLWRLRQVDLGGPRLERLNPPIFYPRLCHFTFAAYRSTELSLTLAVSTVSVFTGIWAPIVIIWVPSPSCLALKEWFYGTVSPRIRPYEGYIPRPFVPAPCPASRLDAGGALSHGRCHIPIAQDRQHTPSFIRVEKALPQRCAPTEDSDRARLSSKPPNPA